jgi:hypothetical protein
LKVLGRYKKQGENMFKFLKVFIVMILMVLGNLSAQAGYYTVSYSGGGGFYHYWYNHNRIDGAFSCISNNGGWGKIMSFSGDDNTTAHCENYGVITATYTYHQTNYFDGTPPSSITIREYLNLNASGGNGNVFKSFEPGFVPDYFEDNTTLTSINYSAYKDTVINSPGYSFSITSEPYMYISCDTGTGGGISYNLKYQTWVL